MLKKLDTLLSGVPATILAGAFLLLDLIPHLTAGAGNIVTILPFDPAWITVIISGFPLLYLALWRVIHNSGISKISSALLISIAMIAAIGQATRHGVVIKSGEALENMGKIHTVAFDKTGTLTYGRLAVSDILVFDRSSDEQALLALAASAEAKSEHPLGQAIVAHAKAVQAGIWESEEFQMTTGKGICAKVSGKRLRCGSESYLAENSVSISDTIKKRTDALRAQGKAVVLIAE